MRFQLWVEIAVSITMLEGFNRAILQSMASSPCLKSLSPQRAVQALADTAGTTHMVGRAVAKQGNPVYNAVGPVCKTEILAESGGAVYASP
jgi:hypothetical protein